MKDIEKTVKLGLMYGMTAYGLAEKLDISIEAAQELIEMYSGKGDGSK